MTSNETERIHIVGDKWLYYKIYTGTKTSDTILTDIIKPVSESLMINEIIDKWFFIRYADPENHIRLRFHFLKPENIGIIINTLYPYFKDFVNQDLIWKIQLDTYKQEIERYGMKAMLLSEELFYNDSKMIVDFINMIGNDEGEELRWLFSLKAMDSIMDSFQYTEEKKLNLFDILKTSFGKEFGMSRPLKKQLDNKYRKHVDKIEHILNFKDHNNLNYCSILKILEKKQTANKSPISKIIKLSNEGNLEVPLDSLIQSYLHMFINRLFKTKSRMHEMVCYDFLFRYYKSSIAKQKYNKKMI